MSSHQTHLNEEIEKLKHQVLNMAAMTERAVEKATRGFVERDEGLAEEVILGDNRINELEVDIDRFCLRLLALEGPVAGDLRFIVGCMRISVDLERIADEAVNIAERSMILSSRPPLPFHDDIRAMSDKALVMLRHAVRSFSSGDPDKAREVCCMDNLVDELNQKNIRKVIEYMVTETPAIRRSVHIINIIRRYERIADLSTNVAETVVFVVSGTNIKHQRYFDDRVPEADTPSRRIEDVGAEG
ncbi:MAG: phosphate signaling complex protein PhoU [Desulfovibrionaceae bacterium]|nr:phosphate signaling complex protein PhoU [Desulfovibrionaceae bacterium]